MFLYLVSPSAPHFQWVFMGCHCQGCSLEGNRFNMWVHQYRRWTYQMGRRLNTRWHHNNLITETFLYGVNWKNVHAGMFWHLKSKLIHGITPLMITGFPPCHKSAQTAKTTIQCSNPAKHLKAFTPGSLWAGQSWESALLLASCNNLHANAQTMEKYTVPQVTTSLVVCGTAQLILSKRAAWYISHIIHSSLSKHWNREVISGWNYSFKEGPKKKSVLVYMVF